MHSSEVYGFGMPSPSPEFASTFESEVFETSDGGGWVRGGGVMVMMVFFVSDGQLLPEPDEMQELGAKFRYWRK